MGLTDRQIRPVKSRLPLPQIYPLFRRVGELPQPAQAEGRAGFQVRATSIYKKRETRK